VQNVPKAEANVSEDSSETFECFRKRSNLSEEMFLKKLKYFRRNQNVSEESNSR
jgi:hypothetical protein